MPKRRHRQQNLKRRGSVIPKAGQIKSAEKPEITPLANQAAQNTEALQKHVQNLLSDSKLVKELKKETGVKPVTLHSFAHGTNINPDQIEEVAKKLTGCPLIVALA